MPLIVIIFTVSCVCGVFSNAVGLRPSSVDGRMTTESYILEGSKRAMPEVLAVIFLEEMGRGGGVGGWKAKKFPVRIAEVLAKIRSEYLQNTSLEHCGWLQTLSLPCISKRQ